MFEFVRVGGASPGAGSVDCLVVGAFQKSGLDDQTRRLDAGGEIAAAAARPECAGESGKLAEAFPKGKGAAGRVIVIGLGSAGKKEGMKASDLRGAAASLGRRLAAIKARSASIDLRGPIAAAKLDASEVGRVFGEALGLLAWSCPELRGTGIERPQRMGLTVSSPDKAMREGLEAGLGLAKSANLARTLSETPPNIATPAYIAAEARKLARSCGLTCRVMTGPELEKERMVGLINVGKASENKPCLIRLEYTPGRGAARASKPVVLIGKTMTYDTGGLSLKVNNGMVGMKRDKDGGCAVLGAMHAIATLIKPRTRVVALLASAENSVSDEAYRPDDVLRFRNGVTVEITNTDAEGRLVLADALCWACEREDPACIVDLATLTGGVVTALGSTFAGYFCEDARLRARLEDAAASTGERIWRLPMHQEYRDMMKSPVADIINSNPNRKAHPIQGAAFLSYFVSKNVPWAHIDIAGVHAVDGDAGPYVKGPTGWGVRLLAEMLGAG